MAESAPTTWMILPTSSGQFQWVVSGGDSEKWLKGFSETLAPEVDDKLKSRLPSMADILHQAEQSSHLLNKTPHLNRHGARALKTAVIGGNNVGGRAMFSTGSGKAISVQSNSIQKAKSLLEEEDGTDIASCGGETFQMFRTGLGKSVHVRQSSIQKAAVLLQANHGEEGINSCNDKLLEHNGHESMDAISTGPPPEFHTAGGRSISISSDSLKRAKNLFNDSELDTPKGSLMHKNMLLDRNMHQIKSSESTFPPMKFHTAGGQPISISINALKHASRLIDPMLEDYDDDEAKVNKTHIKEPLFRENEGRLLMNNVLVDISNYSASTNKSQLNGELKRLRKENLSSSFKKPRISRFNAPLNCRDSKSVASGKILSYYSLHDLHF